MNKIIPIRSNYERTCEGCTACCRGYLITEINGEAINVSNPCRHVSLSKCTIYEQRPQNPCRSYSCMWLVDPSIPVWMKPNESNVIVSLKEIEGLQYVELTEMNSSIDPAILNWFFLRLLDGSIKNLRYQIHRSWNYAGTQEFVTTFNRINNSVKIP